MTKDKIRIALIGTEFMGRAHSNAWRQVIPFFEPELKPILKVVCGRDSTKTEAFAHRVLQIIGPSGILVLLRFLRNLLSARIRGLGELHGGCVFGR